MPSIDASVTIRNGLSMSGVIIKHASASCARNASNAFWHRAVHDQ